MEPRAPRHRYRDPLDRVWLTLAARLGFRIVRAADAYASTDGRRTILIGTPETLDPDDCLAQMIFHELCHALVQGPDAAALPDWGLDNQTDRDAVREFGCLRLQAALAAPHGLRGFLAPTTDWRSYWDALPADPLTPRRDPASVAATLGLHRARRAPWAPHLEEALAATAAITRVAAAYAEETGDLPSLFATVGPTAAVHPTGLPLAVPGAVPAGASCGDCAWQHAAGRARPRCRQADGARVDATWAACERWEAAHDCQDCGACCREAYHSVTVAPRDPAARAHPELIVVRDGYRELARAGDRCAALDGGHAPTEAYTCRIYADRPRTCRDFTAGSEHCLTARRRVGLSR